MWLSWVLDFLEEGYRCSKCHQQAERTCTICDKGAHSMICWHCENICIICKLSTTPDTSRQCLGCGRVGHNSCTSELHGSHLHNKEFLCQNCGPEFFQCKTSKFLFCMDSTNRLKCSQCDACCCPCLLTNEMWKGCYVRKWPVCLVCNLKIDPNTEKSFHCESCDEEFHEACMSIAPQFFLSAICTRCAF